MLCEEMKPTQNMRISIWKEWEMLMTEESYLTLDIKLD